MKIVLYIICSCIVFYVVLLCFDYALSKIERATGTVTNVSFVPARTYTTLVPVFTGKTTILMPQTHHVPAYWRTTVKVLGRCEDIHLTKPVEIGRVFKLKRRRGGLTGSTSYWSFDK